MDGFRLKQFRLKPSQFETVLQVKQLVLPLAPERVTVLKLFHITIELVRFLGAQCEIPSAVQRSFGRMLSHNVNRIILKFVSYKSAMSNRLIV